MPDLDDPMLGLKEAAQASPGQSEFASDALGQQPAISSSPNGAGQKFVLHALQPAILLPDGPLVLLGEGADYEHHWMGLTSITCASASP